jgi:hypothetical protein
MDEKLNAMVDPHSRLPFPQMRNQDQLEIDPVGIDAVVDSVIGLNPIAVDISGIWFLGTEAAVDANLLNPGRPKRLNGRTEPFQQPTTPRRKRQTPFHLFQRRLMVAGRKSPGFRIERRDQITSIISRTFNKVNIYADYDFHWAEGSRTQPAGPKADGEAAQRVPASLEIVPAVVTPPVPLEFAGQASRLTAYRGSLYHEFR